MTETATPEVNGGAVETPSSAAPAVTPATAPQPTQNPETGKWELKVNGRSVQVDPTNTAELKRLAQLGLAANEKFELSKKQLEEARGILDEAKTKKSAKAALSKAGFSAAEIKEILENELRSIYEDEALSPEEKERRERDAKLSEYERREKEREEAEQRKRDEEAASKVFAQVESEVFEALEHSKLPRDPILGKLAVQHMAAAAAKGVDLSAADAVKLVEYQIPEIMKSLLSQLDTGRLKEFLGKDTLKKLRDDAVASVKQAEAPFAKPKPAANQAPAASKSDENEKKFLKPNFYEELRRNARGAK